MHGMYGTLDAELEVQRTTKRASGPSGSYRPYKFTLITRGSSVGERRGEMKSVGPQAKDADSWISIWKELNKYRSKEILIDVECWQYVQQMQGNPLQVELVEQPTEVAGRGE